MQDSASDLSINSRIDTPRTNIMVKTKAWLRRRWISIIMFLVALATGGTYRDE